VPVVWVPFWGVWPAKGFLEYSLFRPVSRCVRSRSGTRIAEKVCGPLVILAGADYSSEQVVPSGIPSVAHFRQETIISRR
jgi:hypothetical protein